MPSLGVLDHILLCRDFLLAKEAVSADDRAPGKRKRLAGLKRKFRVLR